MKLQFTLNLDLMTAVDAGAGSRAMGSGQPRSGNDPAEADVPPQNPHRMRQRQLAKGSSAAGWGPAESWQTMLKDCCSTHEDSD